MNTPLDRLGELFEEFKKEGLVDIKLSTRDLKDVTVEAVAAELVAMLEARREGKFTPLKFNDSHKLRPDTPDMVKLREVMAAKEDDPQKLYICDVWCGHPADSEKCWCDKGKLRCTT